MSHVVIGRESLTGAPPSGGVFPFRDHLTASKLQAALAGLCAGTMFTYLSEVTVHGGVSALTYVSTPGGLDHSNSVTAQY